MSVAPWRKRGSHHRYFQVGIHRQVVHQLVHGLLLRLPRTCVDEGDGGVALADAGLAPEAVDYINAHGTSTPLNDSGETAAIKAVFGAHAAKLAVSSTKAMTGHMLGAAGAVEAIFTALSLRDGFLPATIHYQVPDEACDLDVVPNEGRPADIRYALSNSLGFGGHNACLAFKKWEG